MMQLDSALILYKISISPTESFQTDEGYSRAYLYYNATSRGRRITEGKFSSWRHDKIQKSSTQSKEGNWAK